MPEQQKFLKPEQMEKLGGILAEDPVLALLEMQHPLIEEIEPTKKGGINDQHHMDAFIRLDGGFPMAVDITGARGEKRKGKQIQQELMPYVYRYDEVTGSPIGEPLPRFVLDVNLPYWDMAAHKMNRGVAIDEALSPREQREEYKKFLGQILAQIIANSRRDGQYKDAIAPYRTAVMGALKPLLTKNEFKALEASV